MNNKGFTLMELLAVIAIIGVVASIGLVSISSVRRKANDGMFADKMDFVIAGAEKWGEDNKGILYNASDQTIQKTVSQLISSNHIETSQGKIIYDNTNDDINNLNVKIYIKYNRVYACIDKEAAKMQYSNIPWDNFGNKDWYCS